MSRPRAHGPGRGRGSGAHAAGAHHQHRLAGGVAGAAARMVARDAGEGPLRALSRRRGDLLPLAGGPVHPGPGLQEHGVHRAAELFQVAREVVRHRRSHARRRARVVHGRLVLAGSRDELRARILKERIEAVALQRRGIEALERIGQAIAEKEVSAVRIYISLAITAISLITALVVLYTGVRGSIISIGRNPMSKRSILRALLQIILTSFLILVIGLFAVYLLLRL